MMDTGICAQESLETLLLQQRQLVEGVRSVQMFPTGTSELPCLGNFARYVNARGVFHFNPHKINILDIEKKSFDGRENEFLNLGPYSKRDIVLRALGGEKVVCITEYVNDVELRSAVGTDKTIEDQIEYFESTKDPNGVLVIGDPPKRCFLKGK